jgi:hypothetical protein
MMTETLRTIAHVSWKCPAAEQFSGSVPGLEKYLLGGDQLAGYVSDFHFELLEIVRARIDDIWEFRRLGGLDQEKPRHIIRDIALQRP